MFLGTPGGECFPSRICKGMHMQIIIQIRNSYGNSFAYPMCNRAKLFAKLTGNKTLSRAALYDIEELGYTVMVLVPGVSETAHWNGDV